MVEYASVCGTVLFAVIICHYRMDVPKVPEVELLPVPSVSLEHVSQRSPVTPRSADMSPSRRRTLSFETGSVGSVSLNHPCTGVHSGTKDAVPTSLPKMMRKYLASGPISSRQLSIWASTPRRRSPGSCSTMSPSYREFHAVRLHRDMQLR